MPITSTCTPFYIKNPKRNPPFLRGEEFSGFFPELFPGAITTAALIIATPATATAIIITAIITAIVINGTPIKVKNFPFKETF